VADELLLPAQLAAQDQPVSEPIDMTLERPTRMPRADLFVPMAASLAAFVLVLVFFAPRFIYWPWLDLDSSEHYPPDFNRAIDTLRQVEHPFVAITNPTNRVINWRLLFPILGHYLHLPQLAFLSLPAVGCLLVLGYVAHLVRRESGAGWAALVAAALSGTTSWFFVSTGWLAYFDAWCVLGMLIASFGRSKVVTGLACLLTPWVDERFVLSLPLVVIVRVSSSNQVEGGFLSRFLSDGLRYFALVVPYCGLRLFALATAQDEGSAVHIRGHFATVHHPWQVADGLWSGLRGLWVFVALAPALLIWKGRAVQAGLLLLGILLTLAMSVPMAHDLSRSTATMMPAAVLGIMLLVRASPSLATWPLVMVLAFNLLTPARHVIEGWDFSVTIFPLHFELDRFHHPPPTLASLYLLRTNQLAAKGQVREALAESEKALRIAPRSVGVQINRGNYLNFLGHVKEAAACYDTAVALAPHLSEVYVRRARFRREQRQLVAAAQDLRAAIDLTPAGAVGRATLVRDLAEVERALREP
jgi:hypothetical protein